MKARCRVAGPGGERLGEGQGDPLLVRVEVDRGGGEGVAAVGIPVVELGEADLELGGVEGDRCRGLDDGEVDLDVAREGGARQVGGQDQPVGVGTYRGGQPVVGRSAGAARGRRSGAHVGQATVAPCRLTPEPTILRNFPIRPPDRAGAGDRLRRSAPLGCGGHGQCPGRRAGLGPGRGPDLVGSGQGDHGHRRSRPVRVHLRHHGSDHRGVGRIGGEHRGRRGRPRGRAAFVARVADDQWGQVFTHDIRSDRCGLRPAPVPAGSGGR